MKLNLTYNYCMDIWTDKNNTSIQLCNYIMVRLGMDCKNDYIMDIHRKNPRKKGWRTVKLHLRSPNMGYWRWKVAGIPEESSPYFLGSVIDGIISIMFPSGMGTLYFKISVDNP